MSKELPQKSETNIPNRTTLEKARQMWRIPFVTAAALFFIGSCSYNAVDQKPDSIETPTPATSGYQGKIPRSTIEIRPASQPKPTPTRTPIETPLWVRIPTKTPEPPPTPTSATETPLWILIPPKTPEPISTKTPTPTTTPIETPPSMVIPPKTPEPPPTPTSIPTPIPTPKPTPSSPTPEAQKTYLKPGQELNWTERIENTFWRSKQKAIDLILQGGNEQNVIIKIMIPVDSANIVSEGSGINVPPGGLSLRINMVVPPGANETCFDRITLNVHTREQGSTGELIDQKRLDQDICIVKTVNGYFESNDFYKPWNSVISHGRITNSAPIPQKVTFRADRDKCSFPIAEQEFWIGQKRIFPHQPLRIPANGDVGFVMYSTLPFEKIPTSPPTCLIVVQSVLEK